MSNFPIRNSSAVFSLTLVVFALLLTGCGPSEKDARNELREMGYSFEKNSFLEAIAGGDREVVELFLQGGMSPNVETSDGRTALHFTAKDGRAKVAKILLRNGASTDVQREGSTSLVRGGMYANTALMDAAFRGNTETVKALIEGGADPNVRTESGYSALLLAAAASQTGSSMGELRTGTMRILLRNGANPNIKCEGFTPLALAVEEEDWDTAHILLNRDADVGLRNGLDKTPLMIAADNFDIDMVNLLLHNGANFELLEREKRRMIRRRMDSS